MRMIRLPIVTLVCIAILAVVGWPGETIRRVAGPLVEPWQPPGRGTPSIDVLGEAPFYSDLFGDVAVERRGQGVAAVRLVDGADSWVYQRPWSDDLVDWIRVDNRRISVVWRDGAVRLIDVPTGRMIWQTDIPEGPSAEANRAWDEEWAAMWELSVAGSGTLVILHDGRVDVLDAHTGGIRWTYQAASCGPIQSVKVMDKVLLVSHHCAEYKGVALGVEDGRPRWTLTDFERSNGRDLGQGRVVIVDGGGLVVRRAADWKILWRDPWAGLLYNSSEDNLGVSADLLIADTAAGIVAYRIADGSIAWRRPLERATSASDAVLTDGRVAYVAADEQTLLKLDARTGDVIDQHRFDEEISLRLMRGDLAVVTVGIGKDQVVG
ncbi:PQQ-binding-like beta-propeller repeat protein [Nonomuraea sp. NPDC050783]|uniref:outer membrane protein assembly factor BamB family protein n=1 Tax=Nonomuraea sp. NPDC050783 TaxID=3154634 RepID=UPI003466EA9F